MNCGEMDLDQRTTVIRQISFDAGTLDLIDLNPAVYQQLYSDPLTPSGGTGSQLTAGEQPEAKRLLRVITAIKQTRAGKKAVNIYHRLFHRNGK